MKIKVCGMGSNLAAVAGLKPDYLGFIHWKPSARFFEGEIPEGIAVPKIGVFVDAGLKEVLELVTGYGLEGIQLHGQESPDYCHKLRQELASMKMELFLIKAFQVSPDFKFDELNAYADVVDFFLFDAKGELPGGNGIGFNWELLNDYTGTTPYFLSGGIGPGDLDQIKAFLKVPVSAHCHAIDINSGFEIEPGLKNIEQLEPFVALVKNLESEIK